MPHKKRKNIQQERQAQILEAASRIFAEKGLSDARMEDIASACGLSKGTVYLYYKNKDDLIEGLLHALFSQLLTHLQTLLTQNTLSVTERLMSYVEGTITLMEADGSMMNIAYEFYAIASRRSTIRDYLAGYFAEYRRVLQDLFAQGVASGEYAQIDISQTAITLIALLEGFTLLWFTDAKTISPKHLLPPVINQFLTNLK